MSSNEVKFDHNTHKVYAEHEELHDDAILDNSSVLDTPDDGVSEHRLVFGIDGVWCWGFGDMPERIERLKKVFASFNNAILISTFNGSKPFAKMLYDLLGTERLYVDSGGFSLWKKQVKLMDKGLDPYADPAFVKECERAKRKFLAALTVCKPKQVFELDNEYFRHDEDLMSTKNYLRQEVYDILGYYPTPVFKMHQGFEYWKRLCESDKYHTLSIGGFAIKREWHTRIEEVKKLVAYARSCGKKVHLLGCQNIEAFKEIQPDTVDYSIPQYQINANRVTKEHPHLKRPKDRRLHMSLYALAAAKSRSFMYDCYNVANEESEESEEAKNG